MPDIIHLLPDHVANQIAAGEVVQRPASVVKELLENAIDAQADAIQLLVKDAGKTFVHVIDNGKGMTVTDARMCFERHATSKIHKAEDLFALHTKGFRGEALASIAAVAQVELKTRTAEDELGTFIRIEGSKILSQNPEVTTQGTSVAVRRLFFNIPARRQFLKSDAVEFKHISDEFIRVALAHPEVSFRLVHNTTECFHLTPTKLRQRIVQLFSGKSNEKLLPLSEQTDLISIRGFVGKPEYAKRSKTEQYFFVNQRYIRNAYLHHAVMAAYEGLIKEGTYPSYFIFIEVDPAHIDINIHPTKTEIKFDNEQALYAILRASVKHSLGQFSLSHRIDFDKDPTLEVPYDKLKSLPQLPKIEVDKDFNPFLKSAGSDFTKKPATNWESLYVGLESKSNLGPSDTLEIISDEESFSSSFLDDEENNEGVETFQMRRKFIFTAYKSGFLIINQSRAHYRIRYEELLKELTDNPLPSQQLLFPIQAHFSGAEIDLLSQLKEPLESAGFQFAQFDFKGMEISGIPVQLPDERTLEVLGNLLAELENQTPDTYFAGVDILARNLAKGTAVKTGTLLKPEEQEQLVNQLFACKEPQLTPDYKRVYLKMDWSEIENKF